MPKTTHAAASSAVILVAFAAVLYGGRADPRMLEIVADLTLCVLSLTATLLTARAATITLGRVRAAWVVMSASLGAFTIAEIIWTYFDLETQQAPFPSAADVFFLLFPVGACVALLLFRDRPGGVSQIRIVLDGLIVAGGSDDVPEPVPRPGPECLGINPRGKLPPRHPLPVARTLGADLFQRDVVGQPAVIFGETLIGMDGQAGGRGNRFSGLHGSALRAADESADRIPRQCGGQPAGLFPAGLGQLGIRPLSGLGAQRQRVPDKEQLHGRSLTTRRGPGARVTYGVRRPTLRPHRPGGTGDRW